MEFLNQTDTPEFIFLAFTKITKYSSLLAAIFLLIYAIIICGNVLMVLVIKVDLRLHTPMYFFVVNISNLDICYTTVVVPQLVSNLLSSRANISFYNCAIQMFFVVFLGCVQIMIITTMAYDRYVAIGNPLRYKTVMRWTVCMMFIVLAVIISFIISSLMVISVMTLPFAGKNEIEHFYCDVGQVLVLTTASPPRHFIAELITFTLVLAMFTIPFLLVIVSYMYIISAVLKIRTTKGRHKAFSTCSSHITLVCIEYCWLGFMYFRPKETYAIDKDKVFVLTFMFATPILNPVVYTLRNKAVKEGFFKLTSMKMLHILECSD